MTRITSRQNAVVARCRAAARGETDTAMLLDGLHLVADALAAGVSLRHVVAASSSVGRTDVRDLIEKIGAAGIEVATASSAVMAAISPVRSPSAIVALADRPSGSPARLYAAAIPLIVVAVDVQDPGNFGAMVRVAEAGGATGVIAAGRSADPFGWKALRGSMGSALRLPIVRRPDVAEAIADARQHGCHVVATTPRGGRTPFDTRLDGPTAILIGGEGAGLMPHVVEAADERVTIPMRAPVESLNAAVATALIVYEARRQRTS